MREQVNKQREQQPAGNIDIDHMTVSVGFTAFHCPPLLTGSAQVSHAWLIPVPALSIGLWSTRKASASGWYLSYQESMEMDGNWPAVLGVMQKGHQKEAGLRRHWDQLNASSTQKGY